MDSFEPFRERAARLQQQVVAKGIDPSDLLALVKGAAEILQIEIAFLRRGDVALKGARALFDQQSGMVCCETTGAVADQALLIAHEIGHSIFHMGSSSCTSDDIDGSRPTEAAPVGLQRVEDYGGHERRELQANVFARDLLLPRELARQLHVVDQRSASEIAEQTGLPKNLVRQQLCDALLLPRPADAAPEMPNPSPRSPVAIRPDDSQDVAVTHRGAPFQLQAGPGTGKTRTLVRRVQALLADSVDPASILVLTYSNRAAGELSERLALAVPTAADRIWVGTFHAFGLDLVRRYHEQLGLPARPVLFDRSDAIEVLEERLPTLGLVHYRNLWDPTLDLRDMISAISRAKDELTGPEAYARLAEQMRARASDDASRIAAEKCAEVARVYALYEEELRSRKGVDFGDLIMRPALLLESDAAITAAVRLRHRHVLVDEYQDVNRASTRLLRAVAGDGKRLWVVGDARQAIYRFRGSSASNMAAFGNEYSGARLEPLAVNYRSTDQIVSGLCAVAARMGASRGMLPLSFVSNTGAGPATIEVRSHDGPEDEVAGIAASIRELEAKGIALCDQAVLCRSNRLLNDVAAGLEARGVPVLHFGSLFEREEVRDLLAILSLAIDTTGDAIIRVGAMPRYALSLQDIHTAMHAIRESEGDVMASLRALAGSTTLTEQARDAVGRLATDLDGIIGSPSPWELLATYLLDRTDHVRTMASASSVQDKLRAAAVWQFLNFVRDSVPDGKGHPIRRLLERVRHAVLLAEDRDLRQIPAAALHLDAVRLMTVHGSKGLEFDAVHVPGMNVTAFPASKRAQRCPPPDGMIESAGASGPGRDASHEDEEESLFFVALSRGRARARLYLARTQANGNKRGPSPFLEWIPAHLRTELVDGPSVFATPGSSPSAHVGITRVGAPALSDSELISYEKCPRRFFYTHLLGAAGGRRRTAFTRTHDCVQQAIAWVTAARVAGQNPTLADAETAFEEIWQASGPTKHAHAVQYRELATRLLSSLVQTSGSGRRFRKAAPLSLPLKGGTLVVAPSEIADLVDGTVLLRRVRTGYKRSNEYDDHLEYAAYALAARENFGTKFELEAVHLSDGAVDAVLSTEKKLNSRRDKIEAALTAVGEGHFPVEPDPIACPRCPHFFICGAKTVGPLLVRPPQKKAT